DLAQQLAHPFSLALALFYAAMLHHYRREASLTQAQAEAMMTLATEQDFPRQLERGRLIQGWGLAAPGRRGEGVGEIRQAVAADPTGSTRDRLYYLALLAEACAEVGQTAEGLEALAEAPAMLAKSGVHCCEAELYRLRGELLLQCSMAPARGGGSLLSAGPRR